VHGRAYKRLAVADFFAAQHFLADFDERIANCADMLQQRNNYFALSFRE
jgi:hypothetical protein